MKLFYRTCNDGGLVRHEIVIPDNALADIEIESGGQVFRVAAVDGGLRINVDGSISVCPAASNSIVIKQEQFQ